MSKKSLLSYTAIAAILLFGTYHKTQAEELKELKVSDGKKMEVSKESYENIWAETGGKIIGKNLKLGSSSPTPPSVTTVVTVKGSDSLIELSDNTIIGAPLGTKSSYEYGVNISDNATFKMTGGSINVDKTAIQLNAGNGNMENVTITSENSEPYNAIKAEKKSKLTLKNITVKKAKNSIFADNQTQVTVIDGSFEANETAINARNGSIITLNNKAKITSLNGDGLNAIGEQSKIFMTGGTVTGSNSVLYTKTGGYINVKDVVLTANGKGTKFGAFARGHSTIELNGNTTIKNASIGVKAESDDATIKMTGGSIEVTGDKAVGASFLNTTSKENTLKDVKISSGNDDFLMDKGISADKGSIVTLNNVTVTKAKNSILADNKSQITITGGSFEAKGEAIIAQNGSSITLNNGAKIISSEHNALSAIGEQSKIFMTGGTVTGSNNSLYATLGGYINVKDVALTENGESSVTGASAEGPNSVIELKGKTTITKTLFGLYVTDGGKITSEELTIKGKRTNIEGIELPSMGVNAAANSVIELNGKTTIEKVDFGLVASNSTIKMVNGAENKIDATIIALKINRNGHIDLANTSATAGVAGVNFADLSQNKLNGLSNSNPQDWQNSEVNLTNTDLIVENGIGINTDESMGKINLKNSKILADTLFKNIKQKTKPVEMFTLTADHSVLQGGVRNDENGQTRFDLKNDTKWTLKISNNEKDDDGNLLDIAQRSRSDISTLNLDNSSIVFEKPTEDHYQTLHIGSGKPNTQEVYNASGDAKIYFNAQWSDGAPIADQKTDRLLINGNVSGNTSVYVSGRVEKNSSQANTSAAPNVRGLSLIQVSGKATENSFKLVNGYTTRGGLPDMYTLRAYGPDSSQGNADIAQNLFDEKNENFWDFRLQPELLDSNSGSNPDPETNIPTVAPVPQTASYLVMPNALFYTGLTDMAKQNALLANIRTSVLGKEEEKQTGFFLYT
ncbi:autotransporter outer membrane beta-barrel domain-containing protein, partial [Bartonella sp. TT29SHDZB]|uniref:autotransporter outer membrane beta-barrel domain-containing protein n=1 Tax=Bartonella sp. TT29SHDZB TaxID=3243581 RepID=UPI0035CFD091